MTTLCIGCDTPRDLCRSYGYGRKCCPDCEHPARVLIADPPWKHRDKLPGKRGAEHKYKCMTLPELMRFQLPLLADDCLLLMWRCSAMQQEALDLVRAWGFTQKSELVWIKTPRRKRPRKEPVEKLAFGNGRYARNAHEVCLICTRGRIKIADHSIRSVFAAPLQEHSRKPDYVHEVAERMVPGGPYAEVFGRRRRAGWLVLGDQVP